MIVNYQEKQSLIVKNQLNFDRMTEVDQEKDLSLLRPFYNLEFTGQKWQVTQVANNQDDEQVVFLDAQSQKLLWFNQKNKSFKIIDITHLPPATAIAWTNQKLYLYAQAIYQWQVAEQTWQRMTPELQLPQKVTLMEGFGENFYVFGEDMVRKISFDTKQTYLGLESWLDETEKMEGSPTSAIIDGYIYLANSQGQVKRYARGKVTNWQLAISTSGPLYLAKKAEQIAILSPSQEMIWLIDKNGQQQNQLQDAKLQKAKFIWWNEQNQEWLTLVEGVIYGWSGKTEN